VVLAGIAAALAATTAISICLSGGAAFADTRRIEIQSASVVGPLSGATLSPAVRLGVVEAPAEIVPAAPSAVVENRSTCRSDLQGAPLTITIPDISYSCPVYSGGQAMLNSGAATQISDEAIRQVLADHPGGPGLLWIAGHRVSHGGAFAAVPDLADGAIIVVSDGTTTASYRIVGRLYVTVRNDRVVDDSGNATGAATLDSIIRPDHGANGDARLLLQTCDGANHRWMIYADLVVG
jgi:sortase (surface protein transpeptidase)